jgi:nucleoside-diphosphate-sugar epimerase
MKIFITGATGFVGKNIIEALSSKYHIYALVRDIAHVSFNNSNINIIEGNLFNLGKAYEIENIDVVIHIAGITKSLHEHSYFKINARGTYEVIKLAKNKKAKQFILISSLAAAGPAASGEPLTEAIPPKPVSTYGRSKLLGEIYLKNSGLTYTIIRPPAIFGPWDKDIFTYFKMVKKGLTLTSGSKDKLYSLVYVKDIAEFVAKTILNRTAFNETFFIGYTSFFTIKDILSFIKKSLEKKTVNINLPEYFTKLIYYPMQLFYILTGTPPLLNKDKLNEIKQKFWICTPEKAFDKLNFKPGLSPEKAFKETAQWYVKNKWL